MSRSLGKGKPFHKVEPRTQKIRVEESNGFRNHSQEAQQPFPFPKWYVLSGWQNCYGGNSCVPLALLLTYIFGNEISTAVIISLFLSLNVGCVGADFLFYFTFLCTWGTTPQGCHLCKTVTVTLWQSSWNWNWFICQEARCQAWTWC